MDDKQKPRQTKKPEAGSAKQDGGNEGTVEGQRKRKVNPEGGGARKVDQGDELKAKRPKVAQDQERKVGTKQPPAAQRKQRAESGAAIGTIGIEAMGRRKTGDKIEMPKTPDGVEEKKERRPGRQPSAARIGAPKAEKSDEVRPKRLPKPLTRPPQRKMRAESGGTVSTISADALKRRKTGDKIEAQTPQETKGIGRRMVIRPGPGVSKMEREPKFASKVPSSARQPVKSQSNIGRDILIWIRELPVKECVFIILLWLPRYFYPWISEMHATDVGRLVDSYTFDVRREEMFKIEMTIFAVKSIACVVISAIADQFKMGHFIYLLLLFLYSFVPFIGLFGGIILNTDTYDTNKWFSVIVSMRWAMALAFIMIPVQFISIFAMKDNMSRLAHYCWTALFVFFEFLNALIVFWVLPPPCGSWQFSSPAIWITLVVLMLLLFLIIIGITAADRIFQCDLMACMNICGVKRKNRTVVVDTEKTIGEDLRRRKFFWLVLLLLPIVFTAFVFATLERLTPTDEDEEWDRHEQVSSTSMFYVGRILGVVAMIVLIFFVNWALKLTTRISIIRADALVLGLPHLFLVLGLLAIIGRVVFLRESDQLLPPPVTVGNFSLRLYFFNVLQTKEPVCIESTRFSAVELRHDKYVTRAIPEVEAGARIPFNVSSDTKQFVARLNISIPQRTNPLVISYAKNFQKFKVNIYNSELDLYQDPENLTLPRVAILDSNRWANYPNDYFEVEYQFKFNKAMGPTYWDHDVSIVLPTYGINRFQYWFPQKIGTWFVRVVYLQPTGVGRVEPSANITVESNIQYVLIGFAKDPGTPPHDTAFKLFKMADVKWPETKTLPNKPELQENIVIQLGMTLAGMSAGGIFVGVVYLFWVDPPYHNWPATVLAVFWVAMAGAAEAPRVKAVDVGIELASVAVGIQAVFTLLHFFVAIMYFYTPEMNFRDQQK